MKMFITVLFLLFSSITIAGDNLDLEIIKIRKSHPSHQDFCKRFPGECEMTGEEVIEWTPELQQDLQDISLKVNRDIKFVLDPDQYQKEEFWTYPLSGEGDCEDNALEKRRRLVSLGYPRAALRMTTAFHREQYYAHALLLVETTKGTFILDQDRDVVELWHKTPYMIEARERKDGSWERFAQDW